MNTLSRIACFALLGMWYSQSGYSQSLPARAISLDNLGAFNNPSQNWVIASDAAADLTKPAALKSVKGSGVVVNTSVQKGGNLVTKEEYGNVDLELDFMLAKGMSSGVFLQGRYELQLADSWLKLSPTYADMGGIGQKKSGSPAGFDGEPPLMNVARAPGLWQHLRIKFSAPKFGPNGDKILNARFEEVYLNGTLIQENVELPAPTQGAIFTDEKALGPLMLQGDEGSVAFRNIVANELTVPQIAPTNPADARRMMRVINPIILNPEGKTYVLRSYLNFDGKKRTHVLSVGYPNQINYSYDVKQGALFQVWRGQFADVTEMWEGRGEPQLAKPLGSVLPLSVAPALAVLANNNAAWPDSIAFDDLKNKGYTLDKDRNPTFRYEVAGYQVSDKITPQNNGESLVRELTVTNAPANLNCLLASGELIEPLGKGLYAIDGKSYYIQIDERFKPSVRKVQAKQELIVAVGKSASPLTYSIIW